jgi:hypothetical protein
MKEFEHEVDALWSELKSLIFMKEIEIVEVSYSEADLSTRYCFDERGEKYYIGLANCPEHQVSTLWPDLKWLRKHFGTDGSEDSPITADSLNEGRRNAINNYKRAIKANVPMWELDRVDGEGNIKTDPETGEPFNVTKLSEEGKKVFQSRVDEGEYIICKIVKL